MLHRSIVTPCAAFLLAAVFSGCGDATTSLAQPWTPVLETTVSHPARMAAFLDDTFGLTGGFSGAGKAHVTTNGGRTWTISESSGGCLFGIDIIDRERVWVCGRVAGVSFSTPGGIRLSRDGGRSFELSADITTKPREAPMNFINESTGWYFRPDTLFRTLDGGKTWTELPLPETAEEIKAISILSADEGFIIDEKGRFSHTPNAGVSWETHALPLDKIGGARISNMESVTVAVRFFDADTGVVAASLLTNGAPKAKVIAFRTANGGADWTPELVINGQGTLFLSPDGRYLTFNNAGNITVLHYSQPASAD